jgi:hypothetical protein
MKSEEKMTAQDLERRMQQLEDKLAAVQDIQEIEKLQRAYGYYLDNRLWDQVVDLFSDNTETLEISDSGVYKGKAGVKRFFLDFLGRGGLPPHPQALGIHMQLQGVVNRDKGSDTAKGRWQCIMLLASNLPSGVKAMLGHGVYEDEYVKEDHIWKIKKMHYYLTFRTPLDEGWVKTPVVLSMARGTPDLPSTGYKPYPQGFVAPFHYPNPVSGK